MRSLLLGLLTLALTACGQEETAERPDPEPIDRQDTAYFTGMIIPDHDGPKGQIWIAGKDAPLWFSNVRDTKAFTLLPEEQGKRIRAIYVQDIGQAESWDHPGPDAWIEARDAHYVIHSGRRGGMGAPEPVPFATRDGAQAFAAREGGEVVTWDGIPRDFVLGDPHRGASDDVSGHDGDDMDGSGDMDAPGDASGHGANGGGGSDS
jgi:copper chaperone NosL